MATPGGVPQRLRALGAGVMEREAVLLRSRFIAVGHSGVDLGRRPYGPAHR
jgi:hypothetical protein